MSDAPPIPPRTKYVAGDLSPPDAFTPAALIEFLLHYSTTSEHKHAFTILNHETEISSQIYVCTTCHYAIHFLVENPKVCTAKGYLTHHYHYKNDHYQCCGCSYTIQATFDPPLVSLDLLGKLASTRPKYQTAADRISQPGKVYPTLETSFSVVLQFIKDLLQGVRRDINPNNTHLEARLGLDSASCEMLNLVGFELNDTHFMAPTDEYIAANKDRLLRIQHELTLSLQSCRSPTNTTPLDVTSADPMIAEWLGVNHMMEPTTGNQVETFRLFGTIPTANPTLIVWLYKILTEEHPAEASMYLDCLIEAANLSKNSRLIDEVASEHGFGKVGFKEVRDACENFDIKPDVPVDDKLLAELYRIKVSDEPQNKDKHSNHLKVLTIARRSETLYDFLKDKVTDMPNFTSQSIPDIQEPMNWSTTSEDTPVGLNNIGNTCYFNSLLQYYFTLLPLRKTVLNIDNYVEKEDDPNWVPKKIGGITVDQAEVRRAKKFVYLLRDLFINLQNTSQNAISPEYDLAYMALLNEKDVEEAAAAVAAKAGAEAEAEAKVETGAESEAVGSTDMSIDSPVAQQSGPDPPKTQSCTFTDPTYSSTESPTPALNIQAETDTKPVYNSDETIGLEPLVKVEDSLLAKDNGTTDGENAEQDTKVSPDLDVKYCETIKPTTDTLKSPKAIESFDSKPVTPSNPFVKIEENIKTDKFPNVEQATAKDQPTPADLDALLTENLTPTPGKSIMSPEITTNNNPHPNRVGVDTLLEDCTETELENTTVDTMDEIYPIEKIDTSLPEFDMPPAYEDLVSVPIVQDTKVQPPITPKRPPPPNPATMMFGKQQDVTECMGNVTYLIEAALKPVETQNGEQVRDMVRDLFYGKARQILTYQDTQTSQNIKKIKEEEFSHLIVDAAQGKDLYDGLDEYFFADQVENFQGGSEATREVTVSTFPPVLQIIVQRVQFDRATANVYKSNAFIQFEKTIYLDRYADRNFESLAEKRLEVTNWRKEVEFHKAKIGELTSNNTYHLPVPDMLEATANILEIQMAQQPQNAEQHEAAIEFLLKEAREARETIQESTCSIEVLRSKIKSQYNSLTKDAYRIHAVFIHQGQANYGHYWVYMYDKPTDQWWKYNDSHVTKVEEAELFRDTSGSTANPYFLVYVREEDADSLVETVAKKETAHA
ncbi:hypothetical protein CLU79DRAFT_849732 [Phycomyces nitens]|nr:hypothetical protein CLU79DRAFT_849732 [Phycomyces nitens]